MQQIIFRFDYESGKSIELEINDSKENLLFVREYVRGKLTKDFFVSFTGIIDCCYEKNRGR